MKTFIGIVISVKMQKTAVVRIEHIKPHPMYRKIMKKHKRIKVDTTGFDVIKKGDIVKIGETKPISKEKHFKVLEIFSNQK